MALVRFLRGLNSAYSYNLASPTTKHENAIYFAEDKGFLYVNGVRYGGDDAVKVKDVAVNGNVLTLSYTDNTTKDINILDILPEATETSKGLLSASDKGFIDELAGERNAGMSFMSADQAQTIANVKAGNYDNKVETVSGNILSISEKNITATVSLTYKDNKIQLLGKDGADLGTVDATPFIKDGMLEDVEIVEASEEKPIGENKVGKFIVFTWKVQDGETKIDYIPVADLAKTYVAGNAIELTESNEIAVVVAESTEGSTNYLVNDGGLKVSEMGADVTRTTDSIQIAGGPLANNIAETNDVWPTGWTDESGNKIIPEGKSLQEILSALFLKVVYGTVKWGSVSWSPSVDAPTVTLSSNGPVEVGSTVTISTLTAGTAKGGTRSATCTASQGYFDSVDGSHNSGNKKVSVNGTVSGTATLACTWNDVAVEADANLVVVEGTNTVKATQSGQTASVDALPETTVYASTNTKTVIADTSAKLTDTKPDDKPLSNSNTDTITGAYYAFVGYVDTIPSDSEGVRALNNGSKLGKGAVGTSGTVYTINKNYMVVALPTGWDFTIQNSLGQDAQRDSFENSGKVNVVLPNGVEKEYNVYSIGWKDGQYKNLVIK